MGADLLFPASERFWRVEGVKGKVFSRAHNERNAGIGPNLTHPKVFFVVAQILQNSQVDKLRRRDDSSVEGSSLDQYQNLQLSYQSDAVIERQPLR